MSEQTSVESVNDILIDMHRMLTRGWCQDTAAKTQSGVHVHYHSPDAACFCLTGALRRACWDRGFLDQALGWNITGVLDKVVERLINTIYNSNPIPTRNRGDHDRDFDMLAVWNDHPQRTRERVLEVILNARVYGQEEAT